MSKTNGVVGVLNRLRQYRVLLAIGLAIIIFSGWTLLGAKPANKTDVFWGMFDTALTTSSVTRTVTDQNETSKADQTLKLMLSPEYKTSNTVTVENTDEKGATTKVVTETIGTPTADYAQYKSIETTQKAADGKDIDFTSVIGKWGKNDLAEGKSGYFNEGMLGLVPYANLDQGKREGLIAFIKEKNVYESDLNAATSQKEDGRPVYVYKVKINPTAYILMVLEFAKQASLGELPGLDPEQYAQSQPLELEFIIDNKTKQLVKINYIANKRVEKYSEYNAQHAIDVPMETIPLTDLQGRLQKLQQ